MNAGKPWRIGAALAALMIMTGATASARVETSTRFLEFDQQAGIIAYELTLRNLGSLPVSFVNLSAEPSCLEGPLEVSDLVKEQQVSRRFTFAMAENEFLFQPLFSLGYTDHEGERHSIETSQSPLNVNVDFAAVDLATGEVALKLVLSNFSRESLLFVEIWSESPQLPEDRISLGDLAPGEQITDEILFRLPPGEMLFNPTLHLSYHAFETEGTRFHRKFYTILQPRLDRVAEALAERE
jgi:hypothetical protein